jgi:hypothetical protein
MFGTGDGDDLFFSWTIGIKLKGLVERSRYRGGKKFLDPVYFL